MQKGYRKKSSLTERLVFLLFVLLFVSQNSLVSQVISNTGAAISVTNIVVVNSKDLNNTSGTLGNNGTINLSGNFSNSGTTNGSGFYNLTGNWTNMGSFGAGNSTVTLQGVTDQTIMHGSSGETFYNLTINNPGNIVTQVAGAGSTLGVLKDLILTAGTLRLDPSTSNLAVGGKATINGSLIYDAGTVQTTTITDILSGPGTINMSGGNLSHVLNLGGATNNIGTFVSGPGTSMVNYNGIVPAQTVFAAPNYRNLTISNTGIKTLQGNSTVALNLNVSGGTFDLGTTTTSLPVFGDASINGSLSFNGTTAKTVSITGNLSGTGSIDMSGGNLSHLFYLTGSTNIIGSYLSGSASTVIYLRNADQSVFASDDYRNLIISGSGVKTLLYGDVTTKGVLTMSAGDINSNVYTLKVTNPAIAAIARTSGKVIGKLQRAIGITGSEYLYPVGSTVYNPLKLTFQTLTPGALTAQFKAEDIGTAGLPLNDDGNEIWDRYITGYWSLSSVSPMASGSFTVNMNYTGFPGIDQSASIIKRTNGGNLELDGVHGTIGGSEITRTVLVNGISNNSTDLAIGRGRPRIDTQPVSKDICEGSNAFFELQARGRGTLTYQWQVNTGSGFTDVINGGVYSGAITKKLVLTGAPYGMNGYLYQCIITDNQGHPNITNTVLLTVNKIPIATATPSAQNECPGVAFSNILLGTSNDVTGTTFAWMRDNPAGITSSLPMSGSAYGDQITGTFSNSLDAPVMVTFTIIPTGPSTTFCVGNAKTATVTVNPVPRLSATPAITTQCDKTTTSILLTSPSTFTDGLLITFRYSVSATGSVTGYTTPTNNLPNNHVIADNLVNQTDVYQIVTYRVIPVSPVGCAEGPAQEITITVNPTPRIIPVNLNNLKPDSSICFGGTTNILLTTPTVMAPGYSSVMFDYSVSVTGGPGIVIGNTTGETDRNPGYSINRSYQNYSDIIQSVYYSFTPKVSNASCVAGNVFVSEIKVHPHAVQNLIMPKTLTCEGGSDATIRALLGKGTTPLGVRWNGPFGYLRTYTTDKDTTEKANLTGGVYRVTVTDNLGCTNYLDQFVSGARLDSYLYIPLKENGYGTTCSESSDGELWIQETSNSTGIAPYEYKIVYNNQDTVISNTLPTTNVFQKYSGLPSGNYKLYITDANNCPNTDYPDLDIVAPEVISVEFSKKEYAGGFNITCKNENDGSVEVESITGGNGGYTYHWSAANGVPLTVTTNSSLLDSIPAGKYYLTTTDIRGCMKVDSVTLIEPNGMVLVSSELSHSPDGNTNISCNGGNDGFIKLGISGGSGNYAYSWSSSTGFTSTERDISGLKAGSYENTVTDQSGCILRLMPGSLLPSFTLTEPAALAINSITSVSNDGSYAINCSGGTGSILISVTGGSTGNYTYTWSTSNGSGIIAGQKDQLSLRAGTYHLVVKDANNCVAEKDMTLTQPPSFGLQLSATNITCQSPGFNNGSVNLTVSGGVAPYDYSWSNGSVNEDISSLSQGYYNVTVTYNNSCLKSDSVQISLPPPLTYSKILTDYNGYNISCNGLANGSISISMTNGQAPFIYAWTGPNGFTAATEDISNLKAGQYHLLITDSNYCTATETFIITEPGKLGMTFSLSSSNAGGFNINCAGDSTGSIGIEPINYVKTVDYLWADGIFGRTRTNLPAGDFGIIITDANNCYASSTITLTEPDSLKLAFGIKKPLCPDKPDGEIRPNVTGGVRGADYTYRWSDNSGGRNLSNIPKGFYKVTVTDMNGCSIKDSVTIEPLNETCLVIPNAISPNDDMINDVWNIDMVGLYPLMEVKIFNRWGEIIWRSEKGYPQPWDGRSNGSTLPVDSYHYIIDLHNGSKPIVGNVTIVR